MAAAESCFANEVGAELLLPDVPAPTEIALFGEEATRVLVSCDPRNRQSINNAAALHSIQAEVLGVTGGDKLIIRRGSTEAVSAYVGDLKNVWAQALQSALHSDIPERLVTETLDK